MMPATQHELIEKLTDLQLLSPDVRFGQALSNRGFLVEDQSALGPPRRSVLESLLTQAGRAAQLVIRPQGSQEKGLE